MPFNVTELRSFIGLEGYYRRFIRNFADSSAVLHAATSMKKVFEWTTCIQEAFEYLMKKLKTPQLLEFLEFGSLFVMETGTSSAGLGLFLLQKKKGRKEQTVEFASLAMKEQERRYTTNEREAFAVVVAFKKFCGHIFSYNLLLLYPDYQAVQTALKKKYIHRRLTRWVEFMAENDLKIK